MFALDQNKVLNYKPHILASQEYKRCLELFQLRNPKLNPWEFMKRLAGIENIITRIESQHKERLEQLAIDTIKNIYNVPDYVNLKAIINPNIHMGTGQDRTPQPFLELTLEQKQKMRDEIQKRITINSLVHGSSMQVWKGIYHLVSAELNSIHPDLVELYNHYTSLVGISIWMFSPDASQRMVAQQEQKTQGKNQLRFNREQGFGGEIEAEALNFCVLLHELNKGVIDWLASSGLPQGYTEDEMRYFYAKADDYRHEHWHYMLGPTLWNQLLDSWKIDNDKIPENFTRLVKLSPPEFVQELRKIQDDANNS